MDIIINILLNFKLIVGIISTRFVYISNLL